MLGCAPDVGRAARTADRRDRRDRARCDSRLGGVARRAAAGSRRRGRCGRRRGRGRARRSRGAARPAAALDDIAALPGIDVSPYADLSPDRSCIVERVATLYRLTQPALRPRIVVTSAEALVRRTVAPAELAARGTTLRAGQTIDRDALAALLIAGGWSRTPVVDEPGTFAVRGGVIDLYAPLAPHPVRVELLGDDIESLRWFDAESQRTLRADDWVHVHPVRETIHTGTGDVRGRLREDADEIALPRS